MVHGLTSLLLLGLSLQGRSSRLLPASGNSTSPGHPSEVKPPDTLFVSPSPRKLVATLTDSALQGLHDVPPSVPAAMTPTAAYKQGPAAISLGSNLSTEAASPDTNLTAGAIPTATVASEFGTSPLR